MRRPLAMLVCAIVMLGCGIDAVEASAKVSLSSANRYALNTVAPQIAASLGPLTISKPHKCHMAGSDAICSIKSTLRELGEYCVTVTDVYASPRGLRWRELDGFCSLDTIQ